MRQLGRLVLLSLLAGMLLLVGPTLPGQSLGPEQVKQRFQGRYNRVGSLEAEFVQRYTLGAQTLVESGRVYFKKPRRMRWEYDEPPGKLFLADGRYAYLYMPTEQLVRRQPLKEAGEWEATFALLLGRIKLDRWLADLRLTRVHHLQTPARWQLRGQATSDRQPFEEIWMDLNERFQLLRIEIRQRDGSLMEFHFRNWKEDTNLPPSLFLLDVPAGTSWVDTHSP